MDIMELLKSWGIVGGRALAELFGGIKTNASSLSPLTALTYDASIAINAALADTFTLTIGDGSAFVFANPTNPPAAGYTQRLRIILRNETGGVSGAITFGTAYLTVAIAAVADDRMIILDLQWDGIKWVQVSAVQVLTIV